MIDRLKQALRRARQAHRPDPVEEAYLDGVYAAWDHVTELIENGDTVPPEPPAMLHVRPTGGGA